MTDLAVLAGQAYTLIGILLATVIFARLALKGKSLGSFRFQLSVFILLWAAAEIPRDASALGLISSSPLGTTGLLVHMASMAAFAIFLGAKSFVWLQASPAGTSQASIPSMPSLPHRPSENPDR